MLRTPRMSSSATTPFARATSCDARSMVLIKRTKRTTADALRTCRTRVASTSASGMTLTSVLRTGSSTVQRLESALTPALADLRAENNKQSPDGTIDLHGLFVQEAIDRTEEAVQVCWYSFARPFFADARAGRSATRTRPAARHHRQGPALDAARCQDQACDRAGVSVVSVFCPSV
jgi:hypothetical protein